MKILYFILILFLTTACQTNEINGSPNDSLESNKIEQTKEFNMTAEGSSWNFGGDVISNVWAYNGTIPGKEIRVNEGNLLRSQLTNKLSVPVTIHWHGMILPNHMDGVSGITQNPIQPKEAFLYEFIANNPGTYWYHSHHESSTQVDQGLYGSFIIEENEKSYDQDFTLMLDEWLLPTNNNVYNTEGNHLSILATDSGDMDTQMLYNAFTVNGKRYPHINPLEVKKGETIRLRFINVGYMKHFLVFGEQPYKVVAADANNIINPPLTTGILEIAPSERIDIEFEVTEEKSWFIQSADYDFAANDIKIPVIVNGKEASITDIDISKQIIEPIDYGAMEPIFKKNEEPQIEYEMLLSDQMKEGEGLAFTINEKSYPETAPMQVKENDIVKVKLVNDSKYDHPMHLHGHHFQVMKKNGQTLTNPLIKDVLNVKPGEEYEIMFRANNPGDWAFHCHDLLHGDGGMMTFIKYKGYTSPLQIHEAKQK